MGNWQATGVGGCYIFEPNPPPDRVDVEKRRKKAGVCRFLRETSDDEPEEVVEVKPAHRSVGAAHPLQASSASVPTLLSAPSVATHPHSAKASMAPHPGFPPPGFVVQGIASAPGFVTPPFHAAPPAATALHAQEPQRLVSLAPGGQAYPAYLLQPVPTPAHGQAKAKEQESDYLEKFPLGQNTCDPETNAVPLVSLGCYCGPKLSFQKMGRGSETLPFDWMRTTIDGLLHFIRADFSGFFDFVTRQPVPGVETMTMYRGHNHSFWHDDPTDPSMHERYHRRFERFKAIDARSNPVLFVRVAVSTEELLKIPELCGELVRRCGDGVRLLVILNFQETFHGPAVVEGMPNIMLFYLGSDVHRRENAAFGQPYMEPVRLALDWAVGRPVQAPGFPNMQAARAAGDESYWGYNGLGGLKAFEGLE